MQFLNFYEKDNVFLCFVFSFLPKEIKATKCQRIYNTLKYNIFEEKKKTKNNYTIQDKKNRHEGQKIGLLRKYKAYIRYVENILFVVGNVEKTEKIRKQIKTFSQRQKLMFSEYMKITMPNTGFFNENMAQDMLTIDEEDKESEEGEENVEMKNSEEDQYEYTYAIFDNSPLHNINKFNNYDHIYISNFCNKNIDVIKFFGTFFYNDIIGEDRDKMEVLEKSQRKEDILSYIKILKIKWKNLNYQINNFDNGYDTTTLCNKIKSFLSTESHGVYEQNIKDIIITNNGDINSLDGNYLNAIIFESLRHIRFLLEISLKKKSNDVFLPSE